MFLFCACLGVGGTQFIHHPSGSETTVCKFMWLAPHIIVTSADVVTPPPLFVLARVHHSHHIFYGQRGLRDVGGHHHFAHPCTHVRAG